MIEPESVSKPFGWLSGSADGCNGNVNGVASFFIIKIEDGGEEGESQPVGKGNGVSDVDGGGVPF